MGSQDSSEGSIFDAKRPQGEVKQIQEEVKQYSTESDSTSLQTTSDQVVQFEYEGQGGAFFMLYLKNLLLTIVTLGVYSFWGRVKIQRYVFSNSKFYGRYFDYHATGKEKFIGFLVGSAVLAIFFSIVGGLQSLGGVFAIIGGLIVFAAVILGQPYFLIGSRKFLLSRSSWSNIRFRFSGDYKELLNITLKGMIYSVLTLGFYTPFFVVSIKKYMTEESAIGSKSFSYDGDGWDFFKVFIVGYLLTMVTFGIYAPFFLAKTMRYHANHTLLGQSRFQSELTGVDVLLFILAVVFSFGIFIPFALNWGVRQYLSKLSLDAIAQDIQDIENLDDDNPGSALADGIVEAGEVLDGIAGAF